MLQCTANNCIPSELLKQTVRNKKDIEKCYMNLASVHRSPSLLSICKLCLRFKNPFGSLDHRQTNWKTKEQLFDDSRRTLRSCWNRPKPINGSMGWVSLSINHVNFLHYFRSFYVVPFNDSFWHHICVSWENGQGIWDVIIDGAVMAHGSAWHQTLNLRPGLLVVGQRQTSHGGGFTLDESFCWKSRLRKRVGRENCFEFHQWNGEDL